MKYLKKERVEIQDVYLMYISYLEQHLANNMNYLCCMDADLRTVNEDGEQIKCGLNDRMLPNAITYLRSEMPTKIKNKAIYNLPLFRHRYLTCEMPWWSYSVDKNDSHFDTINITINMEKITFLQHLIKKLR